MRGRSEFKPEVGPGPIAKFSPLPVFMAVGTTLLFFLTVVPVWNAIALLHDPNYTFWCGRNVPIWTIALLCSVVGLYMASIFVFFTSSRPQAQTEQTILMLASVFLTTLGLILILLSLPLSEQAVYTYNNLMHRCDVSDQTHRLFEYSQVLQGIRQGDECRYKYSVEECDGYADAAPYTKFLKTMEDSFRCSGFCYRPPAEVVVEPVASTSEAPSTTFALLPIKEHTTSPGLWPLKKQKVKTERAKKAKKHDSQSNGKKAKVASEQQGPDEGKAKKASEQGPDKGKAKKASEQQGPKAKVASEQQGPNKGKAKVASEQLRVASEQLGPDIIWPAHALLGLRSTRGHLQERSGEEASLSASSDSAGQERVSTRHQRALDYYPPTLYSDSNYQASCEGMAARDMKHFAGDVSYQMFFQGIFLVVIAVVIGFLKLMGFCFRKV